MSGRRTNLATFAQLLPSSSATAPMRALKIRTGQRMVALTGGEAAALREHLEQGGSGHAAARTLSVSANASTSVTFTDIERAAVLRCLSDGWSRRRCGEPGLSALKISLARDLDRTSPGRFRRETSNRCQEALPMRVSTV